MMGRRPPLEGYIHILLCGGLIFVGYFNAEVCFLCAFYYIMGLWG
jgi:hypothetical protein